MPALPHSPVLEYNSNNDSTIVITLVHTHLTFFSTPVLVTLPLPHPLASSHMTVTQTTTT